MQLNFNIYGFIIGLALVIASWLIEEQLKHEKVLSKVFYKVGLLAFVFAVFGARIWHVFTDFHLYKNNLMAIVEVWNGGLSIFGGVLGGIVGLIVSTFVLKELKNKSVESKKETVFKLLDYSIFGLPVGQAIGRLGNYFNQELYGAPSNSFLKIFIDKEYRLTGFEQIEYYHPLFFYEMLITGLFAIMLYYLNKKRSKKLPKIGSGNLFLIYILYYSIFRFFLDFLRLDKTFSSIFSLGINQLFLVVLVVGIVIYFSYNKLKDFILSNVLIKKDGLE